MEDEPFLISVKRRMEQRRTASWPLVVAIVIVALQILILISLAALLGQSQFQHQDTNNPIQKTTNKSESQACNGFQCSDGKCIDRDSVCDMYNDCADRTDEENCESRPGPTFPSYMGFPRLHFSGRFFADFTTSNNDAENFVDDNFHPSNLCPTVGDNTNKLCFGEGGNTWRFVDVIVTRVCYSETSCTNNPRVEHVIGKSISATPTSNPKIIDIDPDAMSISQIWGWDIRLGEYFDASYAVAGVQHTWRRTPDNMFDARLGGFYKSTLNVVEWHSSTYKDFHDSIFIPQLMDASQLSDPPKLTMKFNIDLFKKNASHVDNIHGRISGTIGAQGVDSDHMFRTSRVMRNKHGIKNSLFFDAPFIVDAKRMMIVADFGNSLKNDKLGRCSSDSIKNGDLYLVVITVTGLTKIGSIDYKPDTWYRRTSGVQSFEISDTLLSTITSSPLAVIDNANQNETVLEESRDGVIVGIQNTYVFLKHPDDKWNVTFYAYQFGEPIKGVKISLDFASSEIDAHKVTMSMTDEFKDNDDAINDPKEALRFDDGTTCENGETVLSFTAGDPGLAPNAKRMEKHLPKAQVYWLLVTYKLPGTTDTIISGDASVVVYLYFREPVIQNPTWHAHIKPIFTRYANLYPVMRPILNLADYDSVVKNIPKIRMSMNLPITDGNYMPVTRDISKYTLQTINNWLDNPALGEPALPSLQDVRKMLQKAMVVELSTIPPYLTGLISIKPGRNLKVHAIIKSIAVQEMGHLTLVANILNAIGGRPELDAVEWTPLYPSYGLPGGIRPDLVVTLGKLTKDYIRDVYMEIEKPEEEIIGKCQEILDKNGKPDDVRQCPQEHNLKTIGQFYKDLLQALVRLEENANILGETIFTGQPNYQITGAQWYSKIKDKPFSVLNISDARRAIKQISEEGEGSDACDPLVSMAIAGDSHLLSHYYKFSQIIHGRQLRVENAPECVGAQSAPSRYFYARDIPQFSSSPRQSPDACGRVEKTKCNVTYAYDSEQISFYQDGVWPILENPKTHHYPALSKARRLSNAFNTVYTNLLKCMHAAFNGKPEVMKQCTGLMETLFIKGSRMVKTPIDPEGNPSIGPNVSPTWEFIDKPIDCYDDCPEIEQF